MSGSGTHDEGELRIVHQVLPGRPLMDEAASMQMGPVTRKIRRAESALQQRVEFEALVSRISSQFVRLRSEDLDDGIADALRQMGEFIGVDNCHVCRVHSGGRMMDHTHRWSSDGRDPGWLGMRNVVIDHHIPWAAMRLRRLDGIAVYSVDTLGPEAAVDQATFRRQGIKSVIFVPMAVGGELVGFIGLDSVRMEMQWTEDAISLLKIVAAIIADGLERRRTEDALRRENAFNHALLNGAGAVIIVLDAEGRIVRFNPAAEAVTGLTAGEAAGHCPWELFVPRDEQMLERRIFRRLAAGAPPSAHEGAIVTRGGERRVISWSTTSMAGAAGEVAYVILSGIDVTETKRLEADVLNVAEGEQSRFGHDLHDGLGQHLTGIEFMSHVLVQRLAERGAPEAEDMEEITRLIREAIGHTRDLARGLSPVLLQSKGLAVALEDLAESTTRHMRGVRCRCETGVPAPVPPDDAAIHLYRIAQEAVANAVKHGRATEIVIVLRLEGDRLMLAVEDNGRGFQEGAGGGKGMGLRVMHYRAGIIGGSLEIVRGPGSGVTVTCTVGALPRGPVSLTE
jgi:PAS domain S-box-containing protein